MLFYIYLYEMRYLIDPPNRMVDFIDELSQNLSDFKRAIFLEQDLNFTQKMICLVISGRGSGIILE